MKSAPVQAPAADAVRAFATSEEGGTLRPNEVDPPVAGTRRRSLARFVASLGIAAAMVLASLAWLKDGGQTATKQLSQLLAPAAPPPAAPVAEPSPPTEPTVEARAADAPMLPGAIITAVEPAPTVPAPPVAPPPPPATAETPSTNSPTLTGAVAATLTKPGSTHVTIKTVPAGAAIFQAGKRLGTGLVELDVEPKMKHRLTALLDGHRPVNFTVDGSRDTVTIMLKPVPRVAPSTTDKPEGSSDADKAAEAPGTTTEPAPAP